MTTETTTVCDKQIQHDNSGVGYTLWGGTRREGGYAIVPSDQDDDERRNCWTAYQIFSGTESQCGAYLRLLEQRDQLLTALKRLLREADDDGITQDGVDAALAAIHAACEPVRCD